MEVLRLGGECGMGSCPGILEILHADTDTTPIMRKGEEEGMSHSWDVCGLERRMVLSSVSGRKTER